MLLLQHLNTYTQKKGTNKEQRAMLLLNLQLLDYLKKRLEINLTLRNAKQLSIPFKPSAKED
jgi:hypothetical protein